MEEWIINHFLVTITTSSHSISMVQILAKDLKKFNGGCKKMHYFLKRDSESAYSSKEEGYQWQGKRSLDGEKDCKFGQKEA